MWAQTYPRDVMVHGLWAGYATHGTGKYEKAIEEAEISLGLDPDRVYPYVSIIQANLRLAGFPKPKKLSRAPPKPHGYVALVLFRARFDLAFLKNDQARMEREMAQARGRLGVEEAISHSQALVLARAGRLRQAGEMWQRAMELAKQTRKREAGAIYEAAAAVCDAVYGRAADAKKRAHAGARAFQRSRRGVWRGFRTGGSRRFHRIAGPR